MMASGATEFGRRHDGAEHEAKRPAHAEREMGRRRDRGAGERHAAECQERDRTQIETEFAPAHGDACRIDQRRQNAVKHKFRGKHDARQAGQERKRDTGDHEQDRRRCLEPPRDYRDHHQHGQEKENCFNRRGHGMQDYELTRIGTMIFFKASLDRSSFL